MCSRETPIGLHAHVEWALPLPMLSLCCALTPFLLTTRPKVGGGEGGSSGLKVLAFRRWLDASDLPRDLPSEVGGDSPHIFYLWCLF